MFFIHLHIQYNKHIKKVNTKTKYLNFFFAGLVVCREFLNFKVLND